MNYSVMAKFLRFPWKQKISNLNVKISCTSYVSVRHQGLCISSHFKLINDPLRINLVFPAKIYTFPTEEIYAVHGGGCLNKEVNNKGGIYDVQGGEGLWDIWREGGEYFQFPPCRMYELFSGTTHYASVRIIKL